MIANIANKQLKPAWLLASSVGNLHRRRRQQRANNANARLLQIYLRAWLTSVKTSLTLSTIPTNPKGQTMFNRNLFTDAKRTDWRDVAAAVIIGLALCVGALAYFDVLFY